MSVDADLNPACKTRGRVLKRYQGLLYGIYDISVSVQGVLAS